MCRARKGRSSCQLNALRCRVCEREHRARGGGCLRGLLRAARSRLRLGRRAGARSRARRSRPGPPRSGATHRCFRSQPPAEPRLAPGLTPLLAAPRLASALGLGELYLKLDTANPTHSFKDRVVAVACAKALELGATTLACSSTGNLANAVAARAAAEGIEAVGPLPGRPRAREALGDRGLRRDDLRGRRELRRLLSPERRALLRARLGVRQRRAALLLRRGLEDGRLRDRRAARLAAPDGGRLPDRLGRALLEGAPGLRRAARARARRRRRSAPLRRAGGRLRARSPPPTREERKVVPLRPDTLCRSLAIGNPADGNLAVATANASGGAIYAVAEEEIGAEHGAARRDERRLRRDGSRASRSAPCARPCAEASSERTTPSSFSSRATA